MLLKCSYSASYIVFVIFSYISCRYNTLLVFPYATLAVGNEPGTCCPVPVITGLSNVKGSWMNTVKNSTRHTTKHTYYSHDGNTEDIVQIQIMFFECLKKEFSISVLKMYHLNHVENFPKKSLRILCKCICLSKWLTNGRHCEICLGSESRFVEHIIVSKSWHVLWPYVSTGRHFIYCGKRLELYLL